MKARQLVYLITLTHLAILGACSNDGSTTAPPLPGQVTILVGNNDGPGADDPVIRQAPDGALISATETDAAGSASMDLSAGDMITVANSWLEGSMWLQTIVGVESGDDLRFFWAETPPSGPIETVVTTGVIPEPVDLVSLSTGCWTGRGRFTLPYTSNSSASCTGNTGLLSMCWVTEYDGVKQAFASVIDMPFDPTGTTTVDLTSRWSTDWQPVELVLPEIPEGRHAISLIPWMERDGTTFNRLETLETPMGGPVPTGHLLMVPRGFPETLKITFSVLGEKQATYVAERFAVNEQTANLSFGVTPSEMTTDPIRFTEPGRPVFSWEGGGTNIETDYIILELSWVTDVERVSWTFYLPPDITSFQVPELPDALATYRPPVANVANQMDALLTLGRDTYIDGYDHFRSTIFRPWPFEENEGGQPGRNFETIGAFETPGGNGDKDQSFYMPPWNRSLFGVCP